ncbi:hypothetical protein KM043_005862 [Ampulex compressa]|nr:hypothetical protein KM043_005862 [Ampulex compressa]
MGLNIGEIARGPEQSRSIDELRFHAPRRLCRTESSPRRRQRLVEASLQSLSIPAMRQLLRDLHTAGLRADFILRPGRRKTAERGRKRGGGEGKERPFRIGGMNERGRESVWLNGGHGGGGGAHY